MFLHKYRIAIGFDVTLYMDMSDHVLGGDYDLRLEYAEGLK